MTSHWWQRPGRRPGRALYHWHVLFHDQSAVRELAAAAQGRLTGFPGLDLVPARWLHLTTYIVGFADEISDASVDVMVSDARRRLSAVAPIPVTLGRVIYHPEAVVLEVEPLGALDPVLAAVRDAAGVAGLDGHTDTQPWLQHISVAYSNAAGPAEPIIAALDRWLPRTEISIRSVSLVAQTQVERSWQWRQLAEVNLAGGSGRGHGGRVGT